MGMSLVPHRVFNDKANKELNNSHDKTLIDLCLQRWIDFDPCQIVILLRSFSLFCPKASQNSFLQASQKPFFFR